MDDFLYTGRLETFRMGFAYTVTTELVNEGILRHNCDPYSGHLLGRAMTAGVLAAGGLGNDERLNLRWTYEGALRTVLVDSGSDGTTRGFISPTNLSEFGEDAETFYGDQGDVQVVRTRHGKVVSSGTAQSILQDVVADFDYFQAMSDQVETASSVLIGFCQDVERPVRICRGFLLQAMPDTDLDQFDTFRQALSTPSVRGLLGRESEPDGHVESVLSKVCGAGAQTLGIRYDERPSPRFECTCNRGKMSAVLRALPVPDREDIVQRQEPVVVHCQFCNERFSLSIDECLAEWGESQ